VEKLAVAIFLLYHKIDPEQILSDPAKLHNTDHKSKMRQLMKDGHKPSECDYCWKIESMGPDYISDRVFKSLQFTPEEMQSCVRYTSRCSYYSANIRSYV